MRSGPGRRVLSAKLSERLRTVLEKERGALLSGALEQLPDLVECKERVFAEYARIGLACSKEEAEQLRALADGNAALLVAAGDGLRAARARMEERRRLARQLDTYNAEGVRQSLAVGPAKLHRRA